MSFPIASFQGDLRILTDEIRWSEFPAFHERFNEILDRESQPGKPKVFKGVQVSNNQLALRADLPSLTASFYHSNTRGWSVSSQMPMASTTVHIHMSLYNPPTGAIGHALATVLGADPKKKMDDDLMRMKTMIEEKTVAYDVAENPLAI